MWFLCVLWDRILLCGLDWPGLTVQFCLLPSRRYPPALAFLLVLILKVYTSLPGSFLFLKFMFLCVYICIMYVGAQGGQNNMSDPMELELQPFVSCLMDVGTGNQA